MRNLKSTDVFAAFRLIDQIGVKDKVKAVALNPEGIVNDREFGAELILGLLSGCGSPKAEAMIYEFLSGVLETPVKELEDMDALAFFGMIEEWCKTINREEWLNFFKSLLRLMK